MDEKKLIFKKRLKGKHQYNNCVLSNAPMAKWLRRLPSKQKIVGSIPTGGSFLLDSEVYSPRLIPDYLFYNLIYIGPQGRAEIPNKFSYLNLF